MNRTNKTMLITGATGLLGSNLVREARQVYEIHGVARKSREFPAGCQGSALDLTDHGKILAFLRKLRPKFMVHCAAMTNVDRCEAEPRAAWMLHVDSTRNLAAWASRNGAHFTYISTDSVFDGRHGGYGEEEPAEPLNVYAKTKLEGEAAAREVCRKALIVRTNFYGWNFGDKDSLAEWMLRKLMRSEQLQAFSDVRFNPLEAGALARLLLRLIERNASGTFHLGARNACSKLRFALLLGKTFGLDPGNVIATQLERFRFQAARPRNTTVRTEKACRFLRAEMPSIEDGLAEFKRMLDTGQVTCVKKWQMEGCELAKAV